MTYRVIGERIPSGTFGLKSDVEKDVREFDSYTDASDYYSQAFSQVAEDTTYLGGDFIMTLIADKDDGGMEVMKRHLIQTTILL